MPNVQQTSIDANTSQSILYPCLGALIGDTVGSVYEFYNIKTAVFIV